MQSTLLDSPPPPRTGYKPVPRKAPITVHRSLWRQARAAMGLYLLVAPTFVLLAVFSVVPFVWAFGKSFYEFEIGEQPRFVGLANYGEYFRDVTFAQSFGNMLFLTGFAVCV